MARVTEHRPAFSTAACLFLFLRTELDSQSEANVAVSRSYGSWAESSCSSYAPTAAAWLSAALTEEKAFELAGHLNSLAHIWLKGLLIRCVGITEPALLIRIPRLFNDRMSEQALYETTRGV